ncbi:MAG: hypothetical protein AAB403_22910 [Planctomycetota bacterium]
MKTEDAIALYLEHNRRRHLSKSTLRGMRARLRRFDRFCLRVKKPDVGRLMVHDLMNFRRWLRTLKKRDGARFSPAYIHVHLCQVLAMFDFLVSVSRQKKASRIVNREQR